MSFISRMVGLFCGEPGFGPNGQKKSLICYMSIFTLPHIWFLFSLSLSLSPDNAIMGTGTIYIAETRGESTWEYIPLQIILPASVKQARKIHYSPMRVLFICRIFWSSWLWQWHKRADVSHVVANVWYLTGRKVNHHQKKRGCSCAGKNIQKTLLQTRWKDFIDIGGQIPYDTCMRGHHCNLILPPPFLNPPFPNHRFLRTSCNHTYAPDGNALNQFKVPSTGRHVKLFYFYSFQYKDARGSNGYYY